MNTPRPPDDRREWSSIDIFIFCNGQENTPPRKYHLQSEELNMWDSTLSHLATLQYGSKIIKMDLYTIDGTMIGGPLELGHGVAYVAVVPPEEFIRSDYHTYLMKASRSWQKRQKQRMNLNNEILQDNNDADTSINMNIKSNSVITNITETENNKFVEKELSNIEYNKNIKSKTNSRRKDSITNNQKQNNQSNFKNNRFMSKKVDTKNQPEPIKKNNLPSGRNVRNLKQNISSALKSPKGSVKTKIPFKDNSVLNYKRNISNAKTDDCMKNIQSRKDSVNVNLENLVGKLKTDSDSQFKPSLNVMLSEELAIKSPNTTFVNTKHDSSLHEHAMLDNDSQPNTQQKGNKDISIKRCGIVNFRLRIRVNDYEVPNDTNNNFKLKIIPSNSSSITEKASQVNIDFDINVATLNKLYSKDNPNTVFLGSINDQIYDSNIPVRKQNNDNNIFYVLPAERDSDKFRSCKCEDEKVLKSNEHIRHPDIVTLKLESNTIDTATLPTTEVHLDAEPRENLQSTVTKDFEQRELQKKTITFNKYSQTEWSDTLLEARRHQDGHYTLHLPLLAMVKNL